MPEEHVSGDEDDGDGQVSDNQSPDGNGTPAEGRLSVQLAEGHMPADYAGNGPNKKRRNQPAA